MNCVPIAECVKSIKKWNPRNSTEDIPFQYIDLSSVDRDSKSISQTSETFPAEAPSRARQLVATNDVLVATVRPNLNGVAVVSEEFDGATASTGFCVLRPKEKRLDHRYLFHWVKTPQFIQEMIRLSTGANYPAVSDKTVKNSKLPLPVLTEQKRIAAILDKADAIRRKRQEAIALADTFLRSVFLKMFGDPVTNPMGWDTAKLKDLTVKIGSGATPRGGAGAYKEEGISLIRSLNIYDARFSYKNLAHIDDGQASKLSNVVVESGDVLLNITGASVCRCSMAPEDVLPARVNQHVAILRTDSGSLAHEYLLFHIISQRYKQFLLSLARSGGATREALTKRQLEGLKIMVPDIKNQNDFSEIVKKHQITTKNIANSLFKSNNLFSSLQQRAFRGDL